MAVVFEGVEVEDAVGGGGEGDGVVGEIAGVFRGGFVVSIAGEDVGVVGGEKFGGDAAHSLRRSLDWIESGFERERRLFFF